jgi:hypothetical protein
MGELLRPVRKDIAGLYKVEFLQMAREEVSLGELLDARERLIFDINKALTDDQKVPDILKILDSFRRTRNAQLSPPTFIAYAP